jgi:acyl-CoA synthetase (AMP-forming)/AMP-acid ligase II
MAARFAVALAHQGIAAGERVLVHAESSAESLAAVLGILRASCVVSTVHHSFDKRKLDLQLRDSGAAALFTDRADRLDGLFEGPAALRRVVLVGPAPAAAAADERIVRFEQLEAPAGASGDRPCDAQAIAAIFYTSGSSSQPKGVAVTHRSMAAAFDSVTGYFGNTPDDVVLSYSSLTSDYGFHNAMMPLAYGGTVVLERALPTSHEQIVETIDAHGVTGLQVFPPIVIQLCQASDPDLRRLAALRYVSSSGQRLPPKYIARLRQVLPGLTIFSNYGLTECKRVAYLPMDKIDSKPASVGIPAPGVRTYLVGDDGLLVRRAGVVGELVVASEMLMQGYWNMPEASARVLRHGLFGEERVLFTGDLFKTDEEGLLYYVSRRDEVFARNMLKVNPREIEQALLDHEGIAEAAVVPVAHETAGHVPKAIVVLAQGATPTHEEILAHCAARLDWHMVPADIEFVPALPLTLTGKTSTRALA